MTRKIGLVLLVSGATLLLWITFAEPKKPKRLGQEPLEEVSIHKKQTVNWLPYLGTAFVTGGLVLIVFGKGRD
ncbi:MAG: hypothetical protein ACXVB0_21405 [Mucilaginibacter sp.]